MGVGGGGERDLGGGGGGRGERTGELFTIRDSLLQ